MGAGGTMSIPYSPNFSVGAAVELRGRCHILWVGDSQSTPVIDYMPHDSWTRVCPLIYDYYVAPGASAGNMNTNNFGYTLSGSSGHVDVPVNSTDVAYTFKQAIASIGTGASPLVTTANEHGYTVGDVITIEGTTTTPSVNGSRTVATTPSNTTYTFTGVTVSSGQATSGGYCTMGTLSCTRSMHQVRVTRFKANIANNTALGSGILLTRQINATTAHSNSQRGAAWPTFASNSGQPWFHVGAAATAEGLTHRKAKLVYWRNADTLPAFRLFVGAQGTTTTQTNYITNGTVDVTGASGAEGPASTGWTPAINCRSDYDNSAGGVNNDHELTLRMLTDANTTNETGKNIIPLAAIFARCTSGGTMFNGRSYGCGYDGIGRAGATVTDWLGYCTQADWQAYFTATVLVPDGRTVVRIMLGHNLVEQSGGHVTSAFTTNYTTLVNRIKAAYAAAFPSGVLTVQLIVPWVSGQSSAMSNATLATEINDAVKAVAVATGSAWFSYYDAFNGLAPFYNLHAWTPQNGQMIAAALRQAMDQSTEYRYSTLGPLPQRQRPRGNVGA